MKSKYISLNINESLIVSNSDLTLVTLDDNRLQISATYFGNVFIFIGDVCNEQTIEGVVVCADLIGEPFDEAGPALELTVGSSILTCGHASFQSALHPSCSSSSPCTSLSFGGEGRPLAPVSLGPEGEVFFFTFGAFWPSCRLFLRLAVALHAQQGVHL